MANTAVRHRLYGIGEVLEQTEDKIRVRFANAGEKSFLYPDVFAIHLSYEDGEMQSAVMEQLKERAEAEKAASEAREKLRLENMEAEKLKQKQLAAARKKSTAKRPRKSAAAVETKE